MRASVTWIPAIAKLFAISGAANFSNEDIFLNFIDCIFSKKEGRIFNFKKSPRKTDKYYRIIMIAFIMNYFY